MKFDEIFDHFIEFSRGLKVISVASCDALMQPNSAPKMLVNIAIPNRIYYLDYKFTKTFHNVMQNSKLSVSIMDDTEFVGYRLNGVAEMLHPGTELEEAQQQWEKRLIQYEADRIIKRVTGQYSTKEAENALPRDFAIFRFTADEASVVKPDRVLRATFHAPQRED